MTITFMNKHDYTETIKVEDVKYFTTDSECLGIKGFYVQYNDGTFNLYNKKTWQLIMVSQN